MRAAIRVPRRHFADPLETDFELHLGLQLMPERCATCGQEAAFEFQHWIGAGTGQATGTVVATCVACRDECLTKASPARAKTTRKRLWIPTLFDGQDEWLPKP